MNRFYRQAKQSGFTIVELLIVIVVIGILASIVIVAFTGVQNNAKEASFKSDLIAVSKKLQLAMSKNDGNYPFPPTAATDIHIKKSLYDTTENNLYYCYDGSTNRYVVSARDKKRVQYAVVDGNLTKSSALLYGGSTCSLIGATWSGTTGSLGYDFNNGTGWAAWAQD